MLYFQCLYSITRLVWFIFVLFNAFRKCKLTLRTENEELMDKLYRVWSYLKQLHFDSDDEQVTVILVFKAIFCFIGTKYGTYKVT